MKTIVTHLLALTALASSAHAQSAAHVQSTPNHTEAIVIDSDDYYELAIGVKDGEGCGAVNIWLSTSGFPLLEPEDDTWLYDEPDITLVTSECERSFGFNVEAPDHDTLVVLRSDDEGFVLDSSLLATLSGKVVVDELARPRSVSEINELTGTSLPDHSAACEPCCGPAPCCDTGGSVGGSPPVRIPITIKHDL